MHVNMEFCCCFTYIAKVSFHFCFVFDDEINIFKVDVITKSHLYPEVERLYESIKFCVHSEADIPDELNLVGRRRGIVSIVGYVDAVTIQCHRHEVWDADDKSDKVDEHN